jgi:hypothetical protein
MSLSVISLIIGMLATAAGVTAVVKPDLVRAQLKQFPRSKVPAWIFTALCCAMGAYYASKMNMGVVDAIKPYIVYIAIAVFAASLFYMNELLAPRALGGFLCFIAVPIVNVAKMHESFWAKLITLVVYIWVVFGIILLMSPWYFRKWTEPLLTNDALLKYGSYVKMGLGLVIIGLGLFVF